MKAIRFCLLIILSATYLCSFANEDIEYIRTIFSRKNIQSDMLFCKNMKCVDILYKSKCKPDKRYNQDRYNQEREEIEKILLAAIHNFEIKVDVDGEPCLIKSEVLEDRMSIFNGALSYSVILTKDMEELKKLVAYIGTIKKSSMPTKLAYYFFSGQDFWEDDPKGRERFYKERAKQQKTELKNREIMRYRQFIIEICAEAMPSWKNKMSEDEFNNFVSVLEDMGKMNALEKANLERRVISKDEWTKRVDAWWALPLEKREAM